MPIHTFNCINDKLTKEFFKTYGNLRVNETDAKISEAFTNWHDNTDAKVKKRIVLIPVEDKCLTYLVDILDIGGELKIQEKFQKSENNVIYKGLLYDDESVYIYRKAVFEVSEKNLCGSVA